jgi:hypothetical protein
MQFRQDLYKKQNWGPRDLLFLVKNWSPNIPFFVMNMDLFVSWPFRQIIRDPFSLDYLKSNPHVNVTWLRVEGVHGGLPTDLSYTMILAHEYQWYHRICEYIWAKVPDSQEAGSEHPLLFGFYKLAHKTSGYLFGAWLPYGCLYNVIFWFSFLI